MKIKLKVRRKLSLEHLVFFFAMFFVFSYGLLEHVSISIPLFSQLKFPLLYAGGICILSQLNLFLKNCLKKKYFYFLLMLMLFFGLLLLSVYANRSASIGTSPMYATVRLILYMAELFALMIWAAERGKREAVFRFLFWYTLVLAILTDVLLFTRAIVFNPGRHETYLIGTKFTVSYLHMDLLVLWFLQNREHFLGERKAKWIAVFSVFLILAITIRIDCVTGILGCVALLIMFMLLDTRFQENFMRFTSPILLSLILVASVVFPFLAEWITAVPVVKFLLEVMLGRDSSLTGRLNIFRIFGRRMEGHWLFGYGFGNGNAASEQLFGYANAQNAILQWVIQTGIPITVIFCLMILMIFRQLSKSTRKRMVMPLVVLVYVYVILGSVETTFSMSFIMWLALIFMCVNVKEGSI